MREAAIEAYVDAFLDEMPPSDLVKTAGAVAVVLCAGEEMRKTAADRPPTAAEIFARVSARNPRHASLGPLVRTPGENIPGIREDIATLDKRDYRPALAKLDPASRRVFEIADARGDDASAVGNRLARLNSMPGAGSAPSRPTRATVRGNITPEADGRFRVRWGSNGSAGSAPYTAAELSKMGLDNPLDKPMQSAASGARAAVSSAGSAARSVGSAARAVASSVPAPFRGAGSVARGVSNLAGRVAGAVSPAVGAVGRIGRDAASAVAGRPKTGTPVAKAMPGPRSGRETAWTGGGPRYGQNTSEMKFAGFKDSVIGGWDRGMNFIGSHGPTAIGAGAGVLGATILTGLSSRRPGERRPWLRNILLGGLLGGGLVKGLEAVKNLSPAAAVAQP